MAWGTGEVNARGDAVHRILRAFYPGHQPALPPGLEPVIWADLHLNLEFHPSQFPDAVRADLHESLRKRSLDHKFHYESHKQATKWLSVHETYSPARTDPACQSLYDTMAREVGSDLKSASARRLLALGCGGGQKEVALLKLLQESGLTLDLLPVDVSPTLVMETHLRAREEGLISEQDRETAAPAGLVCDLNASEDWSAAFSAFPDVSAPRVITYFGMLPNVEPATALPRLAALLRPGDHLLISANLAPGPDYQAGVARIAPLYNNALTNDWLVTTLQDLGLNLVPGDVRWNIVPCPAGSGLLRMEATATLTGDQSVVVDQQRYDYGQGDSFQLLYSYRYTPGHLEQLLKAHQLRVARRWITPSGEEGIFQVEC